MIQTAGHAAITAANGSADVAGRFGSSVPGLSSEQVEMIALAQRHARPIFRAARVAAFSGWTSAVLAGLTLLTGLGSLSAMALGLALGVIAIVELRGGAGLRRFDSSAPRRLGLNQIALFGVLCVYCGWNIIDTLQGPNPYAEYMTAGADVANMVRPIARLHTTIMVAFYGLVIGGSAVAQGCAAFYYFTRASRLADFMAMTPPWTVQALQATAG